MIRTLERAFAVLALAFLMNALLPFYAEWRVVVRSVADEGQGNIKFQVISMTIFSIGILIALTDYRRLWRLAVGNPMVVLLLAYVLFSAFWSPYPDATFRRGFALVLTTVFAAYLVLRFPPRELLQLLGWALLLVGALSFFFALFTVWGTHRMGPHTGLWRGTFGHKNELGLWSALMVVVGFLLQGQAQHLMRVLWVCLIGMGVVLLGMAHSATSVAVASGTLVVWPLIKALRAGRLPKSVKIPVVLMLGFGGLMVAAVNLFAVGLEALGRDATLTGRTTLWNLALEAGMREPWFGTGYRAFWTEKGAAAVYANLGSWDAVGNGHNGYLDVWLELGFIGLAIFGAMLVVSVRRVWPRLVDTKDHVGAFYALFLVFFLVYSLPEKVILEQSHLMWVMFLMVMMWLTPERRRFAAAAPRPPQPTAQVVPIGPRRPMGGPSPAPAGS
jgi:O-antigen ligase